MVALVVALLLPLVPVLLKLWPTHEICDTQQGPNLWLAKYIFWFIRRLLASADMLTD